MAPTALVRSGLFVHHRPCCCIMLMSHAGRQTRRAATAALGPKVVRPHHSWSGCDSLTSAALVISHHRSLAGTRPMGPFDSHKQSKNVITDCWRNLVRTSPCVVEHTSTVPPRLRTTAVLQRRHAGPLFIGESAGTSTLHSSDVHIIRILMSPKDEGGCRSCLL